MPTKKATRIMLPNPSEAVMAASPLKADVSISKSPSETISNVEPTRVDGPGILELVDAELCYRGNDICLLERTLIEVVPHGLCNGHG